MPHERTLYYRIKQESLRAFSVFSFLLLLALPVKTFAQNKLIEQARDYLDNKEYSKATEAYKKLRIAMPDNADIYNSYLSSLMGIKDTKAAEDLVKSQLEKRPNDPMLIIDLGNVYKAMGKTKKADEQFETSIKYVNGDDMLTQQMANALGNSGNETYAIRVYERAIELTQNPSLYSAPLARLYNRAGQTEKAITAIISGGLGMQMRGEETVETSLLEITGKDKEKIKIARKAIIKQINLQPGNFYYTYLLIWLFSLQDDWEQALIQVQALEKRSTDKGRLLMEFAASANKQKQYDIAVKAYDVINSYGNSNPYYTQSREARLSTRLLQLQNNPAYTASDIETLQKDYSDFLNEYPQYNSGTIINDYALLEAQYANNVKHAIELLNNVIAQQGANKVFIANCKLQLGDYYIIDNKVWDAALMYSQVDKSFREDALGEEARYRNAKLSYYRGDFEMAQGQLSVLKASTSELIANDALYLSVLITENVTPDSNLVPLNRFAFADLLLFQNKDSAATVLLDSIATAFPKHPLNDDILLLHAKMAIKHHNYSKGIDYLKKIVEQYGKDVLADDAVYRMAEISDQVLNQKEEAKRYYEQLIIDYPGSTYVQAARNSLTRLQTNITP